MAATKSKRNATLDLFKLIASFLVIFIHVGMYGIADCIVDGIARFAVPLFFVTAGYFAYRNDMAKLGKKALSILRMLVFSALLYYLFEIVLNFCEGGGDAVADFLLGAISIKNIVKFLVFNQTYSSLLLWFLAALLYVYLLHMLVCRLGISDRVIFIACAAGLVLHLLLGEGMNVLGKSVSGLLTRNFLLPGYACFGMGMLAKKQEARLMAVSDRVSVACIVAGCALGIASACLFFKSPFYFGSLLIIFGIMAVSLRHPDFKNSQRMGVLLASSKYIYILHVIVSAIFTRICAACTIDVKAPLYVNIRPFAVIILTTLVSMLAVVIEMRLAARKKAKS